MAYLGRGIENLSDRVVLDSLTASATASYTLQLNSVNFVPSSAESLTVSLNGVIQAPISSYTVSGSSIVFASSLSASDSIDFIIAERGITLQTPSAGSVGTSQLASTAVTTAKIANDAVTKDKVSNLMYPAFHAFLSASTNPADNVATKTACDTELFDSDNCYDNSTNYRFTPTVAGKYFVYTRGRCSASSTANLVNSYFMIYKNGSEIFRTDNNFNGNQIVVDSPGVEGIVDMNGTTDYIESFHRINTGNGTGMSLTGNATYGRTFFGAYRIGD